MAIMDKQTHVAQPLTRPSLLTNKTVVSPYSTVQKPQKSALHGFFLLAADSRWRLIRQTHTQAIQEQQHFRARFGITLE